MQADEEPKLNLVQSAHAHYPTYLQTCSNQGLRWLLNDTAGDKGNLDGKLSASAFNLLAAQRPDANSVKSA